MRAAKIVIVTIFVMVVVEVLAVEIFLRVHKFSKGEAFMARRYFCSARAKYLSAW